MKLSCRRALTLGGFTLHLLAAAWLLCGIACLAAEGDDPQPGGSLEFPAWVFDRGNANVLANSDSPIHYRNKWPELLVGDGGRTPWMVEYDIDLPVDATYTVSVRYAAAEPRPLELWLDGRLVGTCCATTTRTPTRFTPNPYYMRSRRMVFHCALFRSGPKRQSCTLPRGRTH